jgi:phosphatidylserine decarboxylase precursor-related protein
MAEIGVVKEGYPFIGIFLVIAAVIAFVFHPYWAIIPLALALFMAFFFRNPNREINMDKSVIVSPADGRVMSITEVDDEFVGEPAQKVTIFLSVLDVHVNRSPINGEIKFQEYFVGRFKAAYKTIATFENERHAIGIENDEIKVVVIQIAGLIARRIVSWVTLGNSLEKGQLYGLIKFGSCTELIVPKRVDILVKAGQHIKGGETIIGRIIS